MTGVDDHSRYCVLARVVERATGRAICLAFARRWSAMGRRRRCSPITASSSPIASAAAARCCSTRSAGATGSRTGSRRRARRPRPARSSASIRRCGASCSTTRARSRRCLRRRPRSMTGSANTTPSGRTRRSRPRAPVTPAERFQPAAGRAARAAAAVAARRAGRRPGAGGARRPPSARSTPAPRRQAVDGGPVEFDRVVPPSGNLWAMRRQFWLGPQRAGQTVRFWAGVDVIHLSIAGARVKSLRSHLSTADLAQLAQRGRGRGRSAAAAAGRGRGGDRGRPRGQQQRPRLASAGTQVLAAEILGGRPVIVRIEPQTLMFLDPETRELLRVRPNPLTPEQALRLQGARPAGPPPRPTDRAGHRSAPRQRHRRDHRLPPTRRARARPRRPHRHRPRLRAHARDRARRRNPHRSAAPPTGPSSSSRAAGRTERRATSTELSASAEPATEQHT